MNGLTLKLWVSRSELRWAYGTTNSAAGVTSSRIPGVAHEDRRSWSACLSGDPDRQR